MRKKLRFLSLILFATVMLVPLSANAQTPPTIMFPYSFVDTFPGNAQHLGFTKGNLFFLGATIYPGTYEISSVTARNLTTNETVTLTQLHIGPIGTNNYELQPEPFFDPNSHMGIWEIEALDVGGNSALAQTHDLDKEAVMPYVKEILASGDVLTPKITWRPPKHKHIPDFCLDSVYRVRLLTAFDDQFHRSFTLVEPVYIIPPGVLTYEIIPYTWVRIEHRCNDVDELPFPGLELRSETFRPLQDLLMEADGS